ncbi:MAG: hypothetical protein K8S23_04780 [Candidatus Cloacimonetes bacterium]|nr:hypothetical protein [Candidatus Cloacimonadota bacterium]
MSIIFDIIGALAIGGLILITMLTTLFNIHFSTQDIAMSVVLYENVQQSCEVVHSILSTVALKMPIDSVFVLTEENKFSFYSRWNILNENLDTNPHIYTIYLDQVITDIGKDLVIEQDGTQLIVFHPVFWLDNIEFHYLDIDDNETSSPQLIRSIQANLKFSRTSSNLDNPALFTEVTIWNYLKNISIM